ncbi:TRAP transporter large permease [Yunchengibacter salinarum]|uniref:TRAP transporter large permease n=1 Tax=Yunchengibacter salinarum TaxID=3133399 RepID=UPI0035B5F70C
MDPSLGLTLAMFAVLMAFLLSGFPVAFTLGGTGLLFGLIGMVTGHLDGSFLSLLPNRLFGNVISNDLLFAVPLFVLMGVTLEKSRVAEDLLESMGQLFGSLRGGLGLSVTLVGALLAASTGIVGATVVTMGLMSLPTMLRRGYSPSLATGSIAASGTLGQIIPPSIVLILLADVLSAAWQQAQLKQNNFAPDPMSAGELFAGALLPGLTLVGLYMLYQVAMAILRPETSPAIPRDKGDGLDPAFMARLAAALLPPLVLIVAVLGSILSGVATPTEAASVGAVGAMLLGATRIGNRPQGGDGTPEAAPTGGGRSSGGTGWLALGALAGLVVLSRMVDLRMGRETVSLGEQLAFVLALALAVLFALALARALWTTHRAGVLSDILKGTLTISTMIYGILIGAALFSLVFRGLGGDMLIEDWLNNLPGGHMTALLIVMALMFVLGFFLDFIEITFVVVPVVAPALLAMEGSHGPIWLGVLMAMNLQTSFLTPPFGFALFYLRGVVPESVPTKAMYRGVLPFVLIQILALITLILAPGLVTWLPDRMFGS